MNIPNEVLDAAAQLLWDVDSIPSDAEWDDLAPSFRASLMTQVEAAAQPITEWARREALREAAEAHAPISDDEAEAVLAKVFYEDAVSGSTYYGTAVQGLQERGYGLVRLAPGGV